jgi:hypothetical protein
MPKGMYEAHAYCCKFGMQLARFETREEANCFAETMQGNFVQNPHACDLMEIYLLFSYSIRLQNIRWWRAFIWNK